MNALESETFRIIPQIELFQTVLKTTVIKDGGCFSQKYSIYTLGSSVLSRPSDFGFDKKLLVGGEVCQFCSISYRSLTKSISKSEDVFSHYTVPLLAIFAIA